jgi:N-acylneuraminate cytidylyltransferase
VFQSINQKKEIIHLLIEKKNIKPTEMIFVGNDRNDIECFPLVGYSAVPNDAFILAKRKADLILEKNGGHGAVREICELLIEKYSKR